MTSIGNDEIKLQGKVAALLATIWLIMNLDTFFTWLFSDLLILVVSGFILLLGTIFQFSYSYERLSSKRSFIVIVLLSLYIIYLSLITHDIIFPLLRFGPLMLFIFWDINVIERIFLYFRNFIIFYAFGASLISLLIFTGHIEGLPYSVLPSQDVVQEGMLTLNRIYGIFVVPEGIVDISFRAGGPFREGGHFAVFLGIVYFVENCVYRRRRLILIIAGLLTFSSVFILLFLMSELYRSSLSGNLKKSLKWFFLFITLFIIVVLCLPTEIKDQFLFLVYERSLADTLETLRTEGLMAALDTRTNDTAKLVYDDFISNSSMKEFLTGASSLSTHDYILSDFRLLIYVYGFISLIFVLLLIITYSRYNKTSFKYMICLFIYAMIIFLHRAWMFKESYILFLMFLASCSEYNRLIKSRINNIGVANLAGTRS